MCIQKFVYLHIFVTLFVASIAAENEFEGEITPLVDEIQLQGSKVCGGRVSDNVGSIIYKNHEYVDPNERCIWTVRSPNATEYNLSFRTVGSLSSLIITGLGDTGLTHFVPASKDDLNLSKTYAFMVTFHTVSTIYANNTLRLEINYRGEVVERKNISDFFSDAHLAADFGHFKYDIREMGMGIGERSLFVIAPARGNRGDFKKTVVTYIPEMLNQDHLYIHLFSKYATGPVKWELVGTTYSSQDYETFAHADAILLELFTYNAPAGPRGFDFVSSTLTC